MPRPKTNLNSTEITDRINQLEREAREKKEELKRLQDEKKRTEAAEHVRRADLIKRYLDGPHGDDLRRALTPIVAADDRHIFGITGPDARASGAPKTPPVPLAGASS